VCDWWSAKCDLQEGPTGQRFSVTCDPPRDTCLADAARAIGPESDTRCCCSHGLLIQEFCDCFAYHSAAEWRHAQHYSVNARAAAAAAAMEP
jgi:hypothetical protein